LVGTVPANHGTHLLRRRLAYELQAKSLFGKNLSLWSRL
jgi:hypothetical protein